MSESFPKLIQIYPQRWRYYDRVPKGMIIATIETTVQHGSVLITAQFPDRDETRRVVPMPVISVEAVRLVIADLLNTNN